MAQNKRKMCVRERALYSGCFKTYLILYYNLAFLKNSLDCNFKCLIQ